MKSIQIGHGNICDHVGIRNQNYNNVGAPTFKIAEVLVRMVAKINICPNLKNSIKYISAQLAFQIKSQFSAMICNISSLQKISSLALAYLVVCPACMVSMAKIHLLVLKYLLQTILL